MSENENPVESRQVAARFFVESTTKPAWNPKARLVTLAVVSRGKHNAQWAEATPSGKIEMTVTNPDAAQWLDEMTGREVAITFAARPVTCFACGEEIPGNFEPYNSGQRHPEGECPPKG